MAIQYTAMSLDGETGGFVLMPIILKSGLESCNGLSCFARWFGLSTDAASRGDKDLLL